MLATWNHWRPNENKKVRISVPFVTSQRAHFLLCHTPVSVESKSISVEFHWQAGGASLLENNCTVKNASHGDLWISVWLLQAKWDIGGDVQWGLKEWNNRLFLLLWAVDCSLSKMFSGTFFRLLHQGSTSAVYFVCCYFLTCATSFLKKKMLLLF